MRKQFPCQGIHPSVSLFLMLSHHSWPYFTFSFLKPYSNITVQSFSLYSHLCSYSLFIFLSPMTSHTACVGFPNPPGSTPAQAGIIKQELRSQTRLGFHLQETYWKSTSFLQRMKKAATIWIMNRLVIQIKTNILK